MKKTSRRNFIKNGLRTISLTGIVFTSGYLGWRKIQSGSKENSCNYYIPCKDCTKFSTCADPKAITLKQYNNSKKEN